jgi:hypothetical protein
LILLPSPPETTTTIIDDEEYDDLPDLAIGTIQLVPMVQVPVDAAPTSTVSNQENHVEAKGEYKGKVDETVVQVNDVVEDRVRHAQWQTKEKRRVLEGLE